MNFKLQHSFPCTVDRFLTVWSDPATIQHLASQVPGLKSRTILEEQDSPTTFRRVVENVASAPIPKFARDAIHPSMLRWKEISVLDKATRAYTFESIHDRFGKVLEQRGEVQFRQNGQKLERTIQGVLRIRIDNRVAAAMGERLIFKFARAAMEKEAEVMTQLLSTGADNK